jgi:tetratricopeptide (TPR) repeat protein
MPGVVRTGAIALVVGAALTGVAVAGGPDPDTAPEPPAVELHDTVATKTSRDKMSARLSAAADKAAAARDWPRAIPLYQAVVVARGPASPAARDLAKAWTLAGQSARAAEVLAAFAAATTDAAARSEAEAEVARLTANPDPFAKELALANLDGEAKKLFKLGRAAARLRRHGDALVYYRMGLALAPDLPGFFRELGATYDKLGATDQKRAFYRRYLLARPFGANADVVRAELGKEPGTLGTLEVQTSLPCEQLWVNRQRIPTKVPERGISVAPGTYKGLCFHGKYEMALFEYATVEAGKTARLDFAWAIIVNALENPYGRISIENPRSPGVMVDLGISSPEIGVAVPPDRAPLRMVLKDDVGTRTESRTIELAPGQRQVVRW